MSIWKGITIIMVFAPLLIAMKHFGGLRAYLKSKGKTLLPKASSERSIESIKRIK